MADVPPVFILLTTYNRLELCLRTVRGIKDNLRWQNLGFIVCDDGSGQEYVDRIVEEIGHVNHLWVYNGNRKGVGHNMNVGLEHIWGVGGNLVMTFEDDWLLEKPLDMTPYVNTLLKHPEHAMIRLGYLTPGLQATLISEENYLYWKLDNNGYQYRFTGHPSIRTKNFFTYYGMYAEGLTPGQTELDMCAKTNSRSGPNILIPADSGWYGFFAHIGGVSMANVEPGK